MANKKNQKSNLINTSLSNITERIPPQNIEAEISLLGSILIDQEAIFKIIDRITPQDFYKPTHKIIFEAILKLFEKKSSIDIITLANKLEEMGKLEEVGGASYLASLVNSVPTAAHVEEYADIVYHKSVLRKLISAAAQISEIGFDEESPLEEILDKAERILFSVSEKFLKDSFVPVSEVLAETFERIDRIHREKGGLRGIPTGFIELDNILAGLQPSDLIILAGRPAMGKSAFALNIALNVARDSKVPVGIFSLEMSKEQIVDRFLCMQAKIDSWKLRTGHLSEDDFIKLGEAMSVLSEIPIFIDDTPGISVMELRAKARRLQAEHNLGLVVIDYLQLMESAYAKEKSRVQEISEISRSLKGLARELNVPVIALSQLSRAVEQRNPKIPQLADLRESGSIEQDADIVMFIYREEYYEPDTKNKNIADIFIKKHRNGPTGQVKLYFKHDQMRFDNLELRREPEEEILE